MFLELLAIFVQCAACGESNKLWIVLSLWHMPCCQRSSSVANHIWDSLYDGTRTFIMSHVCMNYSCPLDWNWNWDNLYDAATLSPARMISVH
jgi:hypothetical protein